MPTMMPIALKLVPGLLRELGTEVGRERVHEALRSGAIPGRKGAAGS